MKKYIVTAFLLMMHITMCIAQIGTWKNYLAYYEVQQIQEAGNYLFVQASNGLYQYNKQDQSIVTYDKVNGLSDTYITHIKWCQQAKRLIAVYQNCNIDLVETSGDITNINAIYTKAITGDKSINSIYIYNEYAYLACGFGIVKLNVKKAEISESYMLDITIKAITIDGNNIYAQASDGTVWTASLNTNLIDKSNWKSSTSAPSFEENLTDYNENIDIVKTLSPGGPKYNTCGTLKIIQDRLYSSNGNLNSSPASLQLYANGEWTYFGDETLSKTTGVSYLGLICLDEDPTDKNHVVAGGRNGLYEFRNGKFVKFYNHENSPIESVFVPANKEYEFITSTLFDPQGNLWVLNGESHTHCMLKLNKDGSWLTFDHPELLKYDGIGLPYLEKMMYDSNGLIWFVDNSWVLPALYQYISDSDKLIAYEKFINQDGSLTGTIRFVSSVAEDKSGNIWIGTNIGPFMFEKSQWYESDPYFTQIKVPRNDGTNYADYLLSGIEINSIAIDGGGRKWFGTNDNGVYLISSDNMQQIYHFTTDNSPLLSNNVKSIAINSTTGEVFFGTDNGLCSFISDATEPNTEMNKDNVWAYPNPVKPDYTGSITITGLTYDADIKIVSSNGVLVNKGRSNGGTYIWDGYNLNGERVSSGIYMVMTATSSGDKGTVCKIAIIR